MSTRRTIRLQYDLCCLVGLSLLLAGIIYLGNGWWWPELQVALGLPFVLFFPGYALLAVLFIQKDRLSGIERVAISFGLSMVLAPLIGLGLRYTPWGIGLTTMLVTLISLVGVASGIAWGRRRRLPAEDAFIPTFEFETPSVPSVLLVLFILAATGAIIYVTAVHVPKTGDIFTEFYILGPDGKAEGYPTDLTAGQPAQVIVGVANHEYATVNYRIQVKTGDYVQTTVAPIVLGDGQKWEQPVVFVFYTAHENEQVQFLLYRQGDASPYRSLHLWVNVKAPPAPSQAVVKPAPARRRKAAR